MSKTGFIKFAHEHQVIDVDAQFTVDAITRNIANDNLTKNVLMQGDHNSERFTFAIPRYVDGHDLLLCNNVQVAYINSETSGKGKRYSTGVFLVSDLDIHPTKKDYLICSWLISSNATRYAGALNFMLVLSCMNGEQIAYRWKTNVFEGIYVAASLDSDLVFEDEYVDVIEQWKNSVMEHFTNYVEVGLDSRAVFVKEELRTDLLGLFEKEVDRVDSALNDFDTILKTEITDMDSEINVLKSRMNTFASLDEGATTGDAEVSDIRVGHDGKTYANAGEAVRIQTGENRDILGRLATAINMTERLRRNEIFIVHPEFTNHYINSETGKMVGSDTRCTSEYIYVPVDCAVSVVASSNYKVSSYNWYDEKLRYLGATSVHPDGVYLRIVVCGKAEPSPSITFEEAKENFTISLTCKNPYVKKRSGKNKLDVSKSVSGYFNNVSTPTIMPSSTYETTEFIDISEFKDSVCISPRLRKYIEYDEHFGLIKSSFVDSETEDAIIIPDENARYIRVTYYASDRMNMQIEDGTECTGHEEFKCFADNEIGLNEKQVEEVVKISSSFLNGMVGLSFGDSIMYGAGSNGVGIMDILSNLYDIEGHDYSKSGSTCGYLSYKPHIVEQIQTAISDGFDPNFILIDGMSNDIVHGTMGAISTGYNYKQAGYSNFATGLEYCFGLLRDNYPEAAIIYVLPHSSAGRDYTKELEHGELARDICKKWSVPIVDVYKNGNLNSRIEAQMKLYTNYPDETTGTHPNLLGYAHSYIPLIYNELRKVFGY